MKTKHFALTGGIASGKSYVGELFEQNELFTVIDADVIAHQLTGADGLAIPKIYSEFGDKALEETGALNRTYMRTLVFTDKSAKTTLEAILHPLIRREMKQLRSVAKTPLSLSIIPLLVETEQHPQFERVIVVDSPRAMQLDRLTKIRNMESNIADKILNQQASQRERLIIADDVLYNQSNLGNLELSTKLLLCWYQAVFNA